MKVKNIWKRASFLLAGAALAMGNVACSDDNNAPGDGGEIIDEQEQTLQLVTQDYVEKTIIPTYRGMADATMELYDKCLALRNAGVGNVTSDMVQDACDSWEKARRYWELSEAWLYGPAADYNIDPHIDTWPLDRTAMENMLNNEQQMNNMDEDGVFISTLGESLLGFHAVEYMLYGMDENGIGTGNPRNVNLYTTQELIYLTAVAADLRNQCVRLEVSWADGVSDIDQDKWDLLTELELEPTRQYGYEMINSGQLGSTWVSYADAMQELLVGAQDIADEVGGLKIGNPTGHGEEDDPDYIESPYSLNSIEDFTDNIKSIQNAYEGYQIGVNGNVADDYIQPVDHSLSAYINSVAPDTDTRMKNAIQAAIDAIQQMEEPFAQTARDPAYDAINQAAIAACTEVSNALTEVMNVIAQN